MVTSEIINDRLTRLEERFAALVAAEALHNTNQRLVTGGIIVALLGLIIWAIGQGFDPASIVHAVG